MLQPLKNKKIDLNSQRLPMRKNMRYMMALEKQGRWAYKVLMRQMLLDLKRVLRYQRLTKSDAPKLRGGWTSKSPTIELDLNGRISQVVGRYLEGLRWTLIGDSAGPEAIKVAKETGLRGKVTPGLLQNSYLHSIDAQRDYFERLFGKQPTHIPKELVMESLDKIVERTNRYLDETIARLRNDVIKSVERVQDFTNYTSQLDTAKEMHKMLNDPSETEASLKKIGKQREAVASKARLDRELRLAVKNFETSWDRTVRGEIGLSSAAGTHQSMTEIYAGSDDDVRVVWLTMEDSRVSKFCHHASFNSDGTYKLYKLSDLKPSGWNVGRKADQWELCIPPAHPNCRSTLVYVPRGFRVEKGGTIVPDTAA